MGFETPISFDSKLGSPGGCGGEGEWPALPAR